MLKFAEVQHFWNTPSSNVDSRFCAHQAPPGRAQISETRFCLPSFQNFCQLGPEAAVCKIIQIQCARSQKYTLGIWEIHFFSRFLSIRARGGSSNALLCYHRPYLLGGWPGEPYIASRLRFVEICNISIGARHLLRAEVKILECFDFLWTCTL